MTNNFHRHGTFCGLICLLAFNAHQGSAAATAAAAATTAAATRPLQTFSIDEYLGHRFENELVHFNFDVPAAPDLLLEDAGGHSVPTQFTGRQSSGGRTRGTVWTVVSLPPKGHLSFGLCSTTAKHSPSELKVARRGKFFVLSNAAISVRVPNWGESSKTQADLTALPPPIDGVRAEARTGTEAGAGTGAGADDDWLTGAQWYNTGQPLPVKKATTTVLETGPVRAMVRQTITFADNRVYNAIVTLAARQDMATIKENSTVDAATAGWRLNLGPGLNPDKVFWQNQWAKTDTVGTWGLADTAVSFDKENVVAKMRPWSFWWAPGITMWAGFYKQGAEPFVGVLLQKPANWSPWGYDGYDRTEIPITARPGGGLDLTFALCAFTRQLNERDVQVIDRDPTLAPGPHKLGDSVLTPLRREWDITVGTATGNVLDTAKATELNNAGDPAGTPKLRRQLLKTEFPLDEVKDYGFDFKSTVNKPHPYLIMTPADIVRVRAQAKTNIAVKAEVDAALKYIAGCGGADRTLKTEGERAFYLKHYWGNGLAEKLPEAYLGSDDPIYGKMMVAAVKGLAADTTTRYLEAPNRPSLGSYGPWFAEDFTRLLFAYDAIADSGLLSPEDKTSVFHTLVFGAQFLGNRNFWDVDRGLASGNPNMTSMIRLPDGLLGLYLKGHPQADSWVARAKTEIDLEISDLIHPPGPGNVAETGMQGGAWYENPSYQTASLDGMLLWATASRNVGDHNYFIDPNFKATVDYWGHLLTPPDRRFPPRPEFTLAPTLLIPGMPPPSVIPSIGDGQSGQIFPFNGWMAAATAKTDPAYSARQQFFWKMQDFHFNSGNRGKGYTLALCNADLPATPPTELQDGYPGFGSVSRTSWTDPKASYVVHRTGEYAAHYHDDFNEIVYYAKGAPLCLDFGNQYSPVERAEPWYHNRVSFDFPGSGRRWGGGGSLLAVSSLPDFVDYSAGNSHGGGNQQDTRTLLAMKSDDPLGANYLVMRDTTSDGQANQHFWYNLWCLSKDVVIAGNTVHFPGQFDVDLDMHVLSPKNPAIKKDEWKWEHWLGNYANFAEEQYGVHIEKTGSTEDYFTVLYPRAAGQAAATVTAQGDGAGALVQHIEGTDAVLLSPGKPAEIVHGDFHLKGEVALARHYDNGKTRLAVIAGDSMAAYKDWSLSSTGAVGIEIDGPAVHGQSCGAAHEARIGLPVGFGAIEVQLDGAVVAPVRNGNALTLALPGGRHNFTIKVKQ